MNDEYVKDEDIGLTEEYLESNNELELKMEPSKTYRNAVLHYLKENEFVETHNNICANETVKGSIFIL